MRKILITATVLVSIALTAPVASAASQHRIAPLTLRVLHGQTTSTCTRRIPDSWVVIVWVYVNGHEIHSTLSNGSFSPYYAGDGTLVYLTAVPHNGPDCATAMSWLPQGARVRIRFQVAS